jgi:ubiquinone/menaquinone biosynthesis C-methylase UbiE
LTNPSRPPNSILLKLLSFFFKQLYHTLAWSYDLVAFCVSLGRWNRWVRSILPYIRGPRVLEVGFGPGHLQVALLLSNFVSYGLDESRQMAMIARRRLHKQNGSTDTRLIRAKVETVPYPDQVFDCVVATFPTPSIFHPLAASEINRILVPGGRLVILLAARHPGHSLSVKITQWLFRITGQAAPEVIDQESLCGPYIRAGLITCAEWHHHPSGDLLIIQGKKPE